MDKKLLLVDKQKMYEIYNKWDKIGREAYEENFEPFTVNNIDHIVFAGMGGSGTIGDVFASILSQTNIHVSVVKGYLLPKTVDKKTLVVSTSVSGNTVETLNVLKIAMKSNCKNIAFSSGGKMEQLCKENNIEHRNLEMFHSPRASLPSYLYSMIKVFENFLPIEKKDIVESLTSMSKLSKEICSYNLNENNRSLSLAKWISNYPLIYYPWGLGAAAIRFKNSLQENSKIHASVEDVIEACHNGIVAWARPTNVKPILITGEDDYIKTKERWKLLKEFFIKNSIDFEEVNSVKGNILSKIINLIYLLDYATIYHAIENNVDPTPVEPIDEIKKQLK